MQRRTFLQSTMGAALAATLARIVRANNQKDRRPRILLRNAWQSQNIGDIAHYLGFLELLKKFDIDAEVRLWPSNLENGADALLAKAFPNVIVAKGPEAIAAALKECDFFV